MIFTKKNLYVAGATLILAITASAYNVINKELKYSNYSDEATIEYIQDFHKEIHITNRLLEEQNIAMVFDNE